METCILIILMHWQIRMTTGSACVNISSPHNRDQLASGLGHPAALALAIVEVLLGGSRFSTAKKTQCSTSNKIHTCRFPSKNPGTDELSSAILSATCALEIMKDVQDVKPMKKNMSWKIVASLHHIIDPEIINIYKYWVVSTQGPFLLLMTSSKHGGDILPTSGTKKKGNWVIKLSNESNAILRTPIIEFTAGSNLIKFVCSHGGGCPFFLRRQSQTVSLVISWYSSTYLLPI